MLSLFGGEASSPLCSCFLPPSRLTAIAVFCFHLPASRRQTSSFTDKDGRHGWNWICILLDIIIGESQDVVIIFQKNQNNNGDAAITITITITITTIIGHSFCESGLFINDD